MEHETRLQLLGYTTALGHQLELVTAQILARAIQVTESTARLITGSMGLASTFGVLQTLGARTECGSLDPARVGAWLPLARSANESRNRVIHSPWVEGEDGTESVLAKGSMKLEGRTEGDLRRDIELMKRAVRGGYDLLRQE
ncbi:hypothetical protein ASG91_10055 [Phycicoccus sp. Soil802]|nr:hypothetical protein ASG91_10055 [Phycicoccus sp. Soil802]